MSINEKMIAIANSIRSKTGKAELLSLDDMAVEIENINSFNPNVAEFAQMNTYVTSFLAAADSIYTDNNGDTVSVINEYATSNNDADRPLSYPLQHMNGNLYVQSEATGKGWMLGVSDDYIRRSIANTTPGEIHQYLIKNLNGELIENGRIKPVGKVRMLKFAGYIRNARDLGGWTCDGGTVKYGKLFRSAVIDSSETYIDPKLSENIGIRHEIDLRGDEEANHMTQSTLGIAVRYHRFPMTAYYANMINLMGQDTQNLNKALHEIINAAIHNEGAIFHCSIGRDRTGVIAFLILALLGVSKADIDKDYELSGFSAANLTVSRTNPDYLNMITYLANLGKDTLRDNVIQWFLELGFSLNELNTFRTAMIDGTPDELISNSFITTKSIIYNLTNCTTSNTITSIKINTSYNTTLTPNEEYQLSNVIITMDDVDITDSVYSNGVISINSVTGNIIITAIATINHSYTNQIPISTDTDGNIFNSIGFKEGYRLNGSGVETAQASTYLTGFIPCASGDIARFYEINITSSGSAYTTVRIGFYDADKNIISAPYWTQAISDSDGTFDSDGKLISLVIPTYTNGSVAYARFSSYNINKNSIITINEEII